MSGRGKGRINFIYDKGRDIKKIDIFKSRSIMYDDSTDICDQISYALGNSIQQLPASQIAEQKEEQAFSNSYDIGKIDEDTEPAKNYNEIHTISTVDNKDTPTAPKYSEKEESSAVPHYMVTEPIPKAVNKKREEAEKVYLLSDIPFLIKNVISDNELLKMENSAIKRETEDIRALNIKFSANIATNSHEISELQGVLEKIRFRKDELEIVNRQNAVYRDKIEDVLKAIERERYAHQEKHIDTLEKCESLMIENRKISLKQIENEREINIKTNRINELMDKLLQSEIDLKEISQKSSCAFIDLNTMIDKHNDLEKLKIGMEEKYKETVHQLYSENENIKYINETLNSINANNEENIKTLVGKNRRIIDNRKEAILALDLTCTNIYTKVVDNSVIIAQFHDKLSFFGSEFRRILSDNKDLRFKLIDISKNVLNLESKAKLKEAKSVISSATHFIRQKMDIHESLQLDHRDEIYRLKTAYNIKIRKMYEIIKSTAKNQRKTSDRRKPSDGDIWEVFKKNNE